MRQPIDFEPGPPGRTSWPLWLITLSVLLVAIAGYVLYPRFELPAVTGSACSHLPRGAGGRVLLALLISAARHARPRRGAAASWSHTPSGARTPPLRGVGLPSGAAAFLLLAGLGVALGADARFAGMTFTSVAGRVLRGVVGGVLILFGLVQLGVFASGIFHRSEPFVRPLLGWQARLRRQRPLLGFTPLGSGYVLAGFG